MSIDLFPEPPRSLDSSRGLLEDCPNLEYWQEDLLQDGGNINVAGLLGGEPWTLLYCDNGHKEQELETYGYYLHSGATLGCHDYGTEVNPEWIEPLLRGMGFSPYRHEDFAALAHPQDYPVSMTRFWKKT